MKKFWLSAIAISFLSSSAFAESIKERSSSHCVPPFPMLNPVDQAEYEKGLSPIESKWVRTTYSHLQQFVKSHPNNLKDIRCCFAVDSSGKVKEPIIFSTDLSRNEEQKLTKELKNASPLPKPSSSLVAKKIFVGFGKDSVSSLRLSR
ncbi:MAG TPA: hypothetical protein EYN91_24270 [Candidatus Melainabacteria bacterium]|nr:hypothetical protein [Candidatus Melainabacteria bacterium]HIN67062.1 hypothetical protein [Candidatus Obscuribacterales bacterium]